MSGAAIDKALLAKIRKCLALSRSANENEAAAALAKARELMDANGIDDATLALADFDESNARASRNLKPPRWESILASAVCRVLTVAQFINDLGDRTFVGRGPRAEIASYAFVVLYRQLKTARAVYIGTALRRCKPGRKRARADAFCEGWALSVHQLIAKLIPEPEPDEGLQQYLIVMHPGLVPVSSRAAKMKRAANDLANGWLAGSSVELNVGVGADVAPLAIAGA